MKKSEWRKTLAVESPPGRSPALASLAIVALVLGAVACEGVQSQPVPVSIGVSDAPVGPLESVVITIDRITINRPGPDIVVETFPPDVPGDPETDTITIDLLDYQGANVKLVVENLMLMPGPYQNIRLSILDQNTSLSYVEEEGGAIKPLKVPSGELKLGGFVVDLLFPQTFVLEFALPRAMTYNPGPDRYILKPRGVRVVATEAAASIAGTVDPALFDAGDCSAKADATLGNVVYVYRGHGLDIDALGDLFDPAVDPGAAAQWIEPFDAARVAADGSYAVAYLPADAYTLAFSCDAENDDAELDDGIPIPEPASEWVELLLAPGEQRSCDFPIVGGACG